MVDRDLVCVGAISGAHGIKGEVKLKSFTAEPANITRYDTLFSRTGQSFEIVKLKPAKDFFIASIRNIADRNQAEALSGTELFVRRDMLAPLKTNEAYAHDLIGQEVFLGDGSRLGKLIAMPNYGAGDLLEVERNGSGDTILIPFTNAFVPQNDFSSGCIMVNLPEGYLDDDEKTS